MTMHAAITVNRPREEVERLWTDPGHRSQHLADSGATVAFADAPGDRGTEIHVEVGGRARGGKLGEAVEKVARGSTLANAKDELRRFKQRVETGEVSRSDSTPEGESAERKFKQRPAQPLPESELEQAGVR